MADGGRRTADGVRRTADGGRDSYKKKNKKQVKSLFGKSSKMLKE